MDACFGSGNGYVHSLDIDVKLTVNVVEIKGNGLFFGGGASNNPEFEDGVHVTGQCFLFFYGGKVAEIVDAQVKINVRAVSVLSHHSWEENIHGFSVELEWR